MLEFHTCPPIEATRAPFRLLRTPTKGSLDLVITSENLLGCYTHFFGGRTVPCTGQDCDACAAGSASRWHGYVSAVSTKDHEAVLFELTASSAEQLAAYRAKHQTLRGLQLKASRVNARPNARVHLKLKPLDLSAIDLPKPLQITTALCHIWGIPTTETHTEKGPPAPEHLTAAKPGPPTDLAPKSTNGKPHTNTKASTQ